MYSDRFEDQEKASGVDDISEEQDRTAGGPAEAEYQVDDVSETSNPYHYSTEEHQLDTVSASYWPLSEQQVVTDRKPPLMKKGKPHQRNVGPVFAENAIKASSFVFSDDVPDVPKSAETVRRKLQLPWRKKQKKNYLPGEEMRHWRLNFDNWRSASQLSLNVTSDVERVSERGLRRTASHGELHNGSDSVSVSWSDSDTDAVSDDPHVASASLSTRGEQINDCDMVNC